MSEYNVNIRHEEGCGESINEDDNDDLLDDLNNSDDNEVKLIQLLKACLIDSFRIGRSSIYSCWYLCPMEKNQSQTNGRNSSSFGTI